MPTYMERELLVDVQNGRAWRDVTTPGTYAASQLVLGAAAKAYIYTLFKSTTIISNKLNCLPKSVIPNNGQITTIVGKVTSGNVSKSNAVYVDIRMGADYAVGTTKAPIIHTLAFTGSITETYSFSPFFDFTAGDSFFFDVRTAGRSAKGLQLYITRYES